MADEGNDTPPSRGEVLEVLDLMAGHAIEVHALLPSLAPARRGNLRTLTEALLAEIGRHIAAELPIPVLSSGAS